MNIDCLMQSKRPSRTRLSFNVGDDTPDVIISLEVYQFVRIVKQFGCPDDVSEA